MQWSTRIGETVLAAALAVALAVAVPIVDPVGRVLLGGAALLLAAIAVRDRVLAPRLRATEDGVVVATLGGPTVIPWAQLGIRARSGRRLGITSTTLELEDRRWESILLVLTRRDLGADPEEVGAALSSRSGPVPEDG